MNKTITKPIISVLDQYVPHVWNKKNYYSQDGEDVLIKGLFEDKPGYKGTFIDIGAYHPFRFSNTYLLYNQGWTGVNVEPSTEGIRMFDKWRKKDFNVHGGVDVTDGNKKLYKFNEPALNTFDEDRAKYLQDQTEYKLIGIEVVGMCSLNYIFNISEIFSNRKQVDLLNIDCEGMDEQILLSCKIGIYQPRFIVIEDHDFDIEKLSDNKIYQFLKKNGYRFARRTNRCCIYQLND